MTGETLVGPVRCVSHARALGTLAGSLAAAVLAWTSLASAAVGIDAISTTTTLSSTISHAHTTSGTDRLMLVGVSFASGISVSSMTYNGSPLTVVGTRAQTAEVRIEIWRLVAPSVGTNNLVINFSGSNPSGATVGVMTFTGVDPVTPLGAFASSTGSSSSASVTVASGPGELVFDAMTLKGGDRTLTPGAGQTGHWDLWLGEVNGGASTKSGADSMTMSWSHASDKWAIGAASIKPADATALGDGTDPLDASLAPGGAAAMADAFTFRTGSGTDTITAVTVALATGTSGGLSLVEITDDAGAVVYGSASDPAGDTLAIPLSPGVISTATTTQYKIRITPKIHAAMPAPPGSTYAATAFIDNWTGTRPHAGSDAGGATVTIDNFSPGNVSASIATAGNTQVALSWTNPGDADLGSIVVLRSTSAVADAPVEGTTYVVGDTIGGSTVASVAAAPAANVIDTGLTNGAAYHYKVFASDTNGNYDTGVVPAGSPATPDLILSVAVSDSIFAFGSQRANTWLVAQSSVIINNGTVAENFAGRISPFSDGANGWTISALTNGTDSIRAQWSTIGASGPWTDISAYDTDFAIDTNVAVSDSVTLWFRIETPTSTIFHVEYSAAFTVTAEQY